MKPMRSLLLGLVAIAAGVLGAQWLTHQTRYDVGEVIVHIGGNDYVTAGPQALLLLLIAMLLLWLLWSLLTLPFRSWGRYRQKRGRGRLIEGLRAADHGQWARAGKQLVAASEDQEVGAIALAGAVRVADARGDTSSADTLARQLAERDPQAHALLQAERCLSAKRPLDAIQMLDSAAAQPLPPRGLWLRIEALAQSGQAAEAYGQLGVLRRQQVLVEPALAELETRLTAQAISEANTTEALASFWDGVGKLQRLQAPVAAAYARKAAALHADDAALHCLELALDSLWDESLIRLYGELPLEKFDTRRASAQRWLALHPNSPGLLLSLGRLAYCQQQLTQAEEFLHRAIAQDAGADAWEQLGHVLAAAGDTASALQCHANALRVGRGEAAQELPLRDTRQKIADAAVGEERDAYGIPQLKP